MQHRYVVCDSSLCTGCRLCELACAMAKTGEYNVEVSRIRTARPEASLMLSVACRLCPDAPCVKACPRDALSISQEDGVILVDKARCTGCGWCIEACDFGAIALDHRSKCVVICDLCRDDGGGPRCVVACPKQALDLTSPSAFANSARERIARTAEEPDGYTDSRLVETTTRR